MKIYAISYCKALVGLGFESVKLGNLFSKIKRIRTVRATSKGRTGENTKEPILVFGVKALRESELSLTYVPIHLERSSTNIWYDGWAAQPLDPLVEDIRGCLYNFPFQTMVLAETKLNSPSLMDSDYLSFFLSKLHCPSLFPIHLK